MAGGSEPGYPPAINTPALRALFNNLQSRSPQLAVAVDTAIKASLQAGWRESAIKVKKVRLAIRHVMMTDIPSDLGLGAAEPGATLTPKLDPEKETERILELAKRQHHDY